MNEFLNFIKGSMVFVGVALLLSFTSKFTPTPINFLEGYGIVMLGVVIKTGYDIYKSE
jgi:hypothetical protein|tara:strand:+ start:382 stop:555 length:174 start_codon:yes stop_codon:yes gene_type:complete